MKPSDDFLILCVNPGSTSTKLALFRGAKCLESSSAAHPVEELAGYSAVAQQAEFRMKLAEEFASSALAAHAPEESLSAVIGRGGLLAPLEGGVYAVNERMCADLIAAKYGEHASNLGAVLARGLAGKRAVPAFIADPVVVDELEPLARYSGLPELPRMSIFHALNQKSAARAAAQRLGLRYEECNFIVAHLGGGVSVGAHRAGRVIDVNNALDGEGPFSPERAGGVPAGQLIGLTREYQGREAELRKRLVGRGGLVAYLGTNDLEEIMERIEAGDRQAREVIDAMAYQISKEIASHGATLEGRVDAIILTGGMAHNIDLVDSIRRRVAFLAPLELFAGEREMEALAENALAALTGETRVKEYAP
jgi:butyrate kinase